MFVTKYASQHSPITSGSSLLEVKNNIESEAKFIEGGFSRRWRCQVLDRKHSKGSVSECQKSCNIYTHHVWFDLHSPVNQVFHT